MRVKRERSIESVQVVTDAEGLSSRAGTALVAGVADRVGLTAALSEALGDLRQRRSRHDPGRVVRDLALTLADGGDCLSDLRALRDQAALFGPVASDATGWRVIAALDEARLGRLREARARARERVWEQAGAPARVKVILDIDGTLVTAHSEKEGAAGTYKGGFGFHPLLCYEATSGEGLAGRLRPGNAGFNTAQDHIDLFEQALAQLPEQAVTPGLLVRCDRGGATHAFLDHLAERGACFSVGLDLTEPVREAILAVSEAAWRPALAQDGDDREGAWVAELSLDLASWPRAICRRERPHPASPPFVRHLVPARQDAVQARADDPATTVHTVTSQTSSLCPPRALHRRAVIQAASRIGTRVRTPWTVSVRWPRWSVSKGGGGMVAIVKAETRAAGP